MVDALDGTGRTRRPRTTVLPLRGDALAGPLDDADPDDGGHRGPGGVGAPLPGRAARRPPRPAAAVGGAAGPACAARRGRCSPRVLRRDPDRARVVVAEPATVGELSRRWDGSGALPDFVARQAGLALDRAERAVVGDRVKVPRHVVEAIEAQPRVPPRGRRAGRAARPARGGGAGRGGRRPARAGRRAWTPVAVELFTGAVPPAARPRLGRAGRHRRARPGCAELNRRAPAGLPAQPPLLRRPAGARRRARRSTTSRATTCSAGTTSASGRSARWPSGPGSSSSGAASATTTSTSSPSASTSPSCWPSASTSSGTWRAAARGPASCAPPRHGLLRLRRRRGRSAAGWRTSSWCRSRSPTTSSARSRGWPPSRAARRSGRRACRGWPSYARGQLTEPLGTVHVGFAEPLSLAGALRAGADPGDPDARRLALQKVAFQVAVGINSRHPGDGDGAGHAGAARGPRPRADPGPGDPACSSRCWPT